MRIQILTILTLLSVPTLFAQKNASLQDNFIGQNSFFAEAGGAGIAFSANIDHRFKPGRLGLGGRIGLGFVSAYDDTYDPGTMTFYSGEQHSAITLPVQVNYIFGKTNSPHTFEVGAGISYVTKKLDILNFYDDQYMNRQTNLFGTFSFMYRRQPLNGGFSWRAGFTPIFAKSYIQPFGALSVGYNF